MNWLERTPKVLGSVKDKAGLPPWPGLLKSTLLRTLKKANEKTMFTLSVIDVFLSMEVSRFHLGSPRRGFARPARPSVLMFTLRNWLKTFSGSLNRFRPDP